MLLESLSSAPPSTSPPWLAAPEPRKHFKQQASLNQLVQVGRAAFGLRSQSLCLQEVTSRHKGVARPRLHIRHIYCRPRFDPLKKAPKQCSTDDLFESDFGDDPKSIDFGFCGVLRVFCVVLRGFCVVLHGRFWWISPSDSSNLQKCSIRLPIPLNQRHSFELKRHCMDPSSESKALYAPLVLTGLPLLPQSLDCVGPLRWNPGKEHQAPLKPIRGVRTACPCVFAANQVVPARLEVSVTPCVSQRHAVKEFKIFYMWVWSDTDTKVSMPRTTQMLYVQLVNCVAKAGRIAPIRTF